MYQDIPSKLSNFRRAMDVKNRILKPNLVKKYKRIKAYNKSPDQYLLMDLRRRQSGK